MYSVRNKNLKLSQNYPHSPSYLELCYMYDILNESHHVVVVVLRPQKTAMVMSGRSVNLTTLFLRRIRVPKRLTSTKCTNFR